MHPPGARSSGRTGRLLPALLAALIGSRAPAQQPTGPQAPLDPVRLRISAAAQFQFAGYYAALDQGYYKQEGLDVSILERREGGSPAAEVLAGNIEFAILGSELVRQRLEGRPLVAVAAIFQESPFCFLALSDSLISSPADLTGKRVELDDRDIELRALLRSTGVPVADISVVPPTWNLDDLTARRVDAIVAHVSMEPNILRLRGIPVSVIRPMSFGVDFYGDTLFTSEDQVRKQPKRVAAFRRATLRGWQYALDHRDEVIDSLISRHGGAERGLTRDLLRFEAKSVRDLILPDLIPLGDISADRMRRTADILIGLGLATPTSPNWMSGFVYNANPPKDGSGLTRWLIIGFTGAVVVGAAATIWNIVLRRAVEQRTREYRESERRLIEAQAIGHVGDWQLDLATGHVHWSREVYRIMDRDPSLGPPDSEDSLSKYSTEDRARIQEAVRLAKEHKQTSHMDLTAHLPGGKNIHQTSVIAPVIDEDGRVVRIVGTVQDITARKEAEATVAASEARFRTLVDHAPDAIVTMDVVSGHFVDANPRACELYGLPREVLLTKGPAELSPPTQPDGRRSAESAADKINAALAGQTPVFRWDHLRSDGTVVPCEIRLVRIPSVHGPVVRGSITDITERLRAEEALNLRSAELERSNKELERFAYVASHDLQEPLRMVTSFTQLLAKRYGGKLGPDADEFIGFAVDGAKRMQMLIDDLLTYSRAGKLPLKLSRFPADQALDSALLNLQPGIQSSAATITRDPLPSVDADQTQLVQLFQNLVSNALKFRSESPPRIHISARADNGHWVFCVKDNGIGIDPRHMGRLFVMFQRLHPRHEYPGSGIGLAVCKMIVERIGGRIWVESTPGQGSAFQFTIPASRETKS